MQLFYTPGFKTHNLLDIEEARHAFKVLRKQIGDTIHVIDGEGNLFECEILDNNFKKPALKVLDTTEAWGKRNTTLHIALAPTKNMDRLEWFVEKAVEIGIDEISFFTSQNSERQNLKIERLEKKAVSAMKQSLTAYMPKINALTTLEKFINTAFDGDKLIAKLTDQSVALSKSEGNRLILIGPEGDFTENEFNLATEKGFMPTLLGNKRLRTETAALYACVVCNQ